MSSIPSSASSSKETQPDVFTFDSTRPCAVNVQRLQSATRLQRRFEEFEASLPGGTAGADSQTTDDALTPASLLSSAVGRLLHDISPRLAGFLDYLGRGHDDAHKPPRLVTADDSVWLLDNVAYATPTPDAEDKDAPSYTAEYVVAVLSQRPTLPVMEAVRSVASKIGRDLGDEGSEERAAALKTIEERITPFLQAIRPGREVHAVHGGDGDDGDNDASWPLVFSPGGKNGLSRDLCRLPASAAGALVATHATVPRGTDGELAMTTFFSAPGAGWGVISDIDDTIKRTQTSDPAGILATTFVDAPTPIHGMPALYKHVHAAAGPGAPFFYLSASPYNLYPFLRDFRRAHYPPGALVLRDVTYMTVAGLLRNLTQDTHQYKVARMHTMHAWLPAKTFVCIGDSTQSDPEAYGDIYRAHPGWVGLILIRKVTDIAALGMAEKNDAARFDKAFEGVPRDKWHVFEDPDECYALVDKVMGGGGGRGR